MFALIRTFTKYVKVPLNEIGAISWNLKRRERKNSGKVVADSQKPDGDWDFTDSHKHRERIPGFIDSVEFKFVSILCKMYNHSTERYLGDFLEFKTPREEKDWSDSRKPVGGWDFTDLHKQREPIPGVAANCH